MSVLEWFTFQSENPKCISEDDLLKIYEIEQDMWAEWIWEYLKCNTCWEIYSKKDIYGNLKADLYIETVSELEKQTLFNEFECKCCWNETIHIWWKEYLNWIKDRYNDNEVFLTTIRNNVWEIVGFTDAYINDIDTIYFREFERYYYTLWLDEIKNKIWLILNWEVPNKILMHSTTWIENKYANLAMFLRILCEFYRYLQSQWYNEILWIYEACIWSTAHSLYHVAGAKRIWLTINNVKLENTYKGSVSDIFVHENIVPLIIKNFSLPVKNFMKMNSSKMKEVLIR